MNDTRTSLDAQYCSLEMPRQNTRKCTDLRIQIRPREIGAWLCLAAIDEGLCGDLADLLLLPIKQPLQRFPMRLQRGASADAPLVGRLDLKARVGASVKVGRPYPLSPTNLC